MTTPFLIITILLSAALIVLIILYIRSQQEIQQVKTALSLLSEEKLPGVEQSLEKTLSQVNQSIEDFKAQVRSSLQALPQITQILGELRAGTSAWEQFLEKLKGLFSDTTRKGQVGEFLLERILKGALPSYLWSHQYKLAEGLRPDAVVFLPTGRDDRVILPIDSKVSTAAAREFLEEKDQKKKESLWKRFTRDVLSRAEEIKRYIIPGKTTEFALMFVPSEDILSLITAPYTWNGKAQNNLLHELHARRVIPVGPSTIYSILAIVLAQHQALTLEKKLDQFLGLVKTALSSNQEALKSLDKVSSGVKKIEENAGKARREIEKSVDNLRATFTLEELPREKPPKTLEPPWDEEGEGENGEDLELPF